MNHDNNSCDHRLDEEIIRLENVSVNYDAMRPVLSHINLSIRRGDFVAISGPNGGGKTTLLRCMLKLLRPTEGRVEYLRDGRIVKHLPIGYLPQKSMIDTRFPISVEECVMSGLDKGWFGRRPSDAPQRFERVAEMCGIGGYLRKSIGELSGGQLQRTLLARAVISNPEVLVLDEPLSYVDKHFEHKIYSIVEELARHTTILLVSHEMSVISGMATRHLIVDHGLTPCHALRHYVPGCDDEDNICSGKDSDCCSGKESDCGSGKESDCCRGKESDCGCREEEAE